MCALILTPARELAVQIAEQLTAVGKPMNVHVLTVIGGMNSIHQTAELQNNPHIVVGTPGRCAQLVAQGSLRLRKLAFLVLDEADRLISQGFEEDLATILKHSNRRRQTLLFSATMNKSLEELEGMSMKNPFHWDQNAARDGGEGFATVRSLTQRMMLVPEAARDAYVVYLARTYASADTSLILFCNTVEDTAQLAHMLEHLLADDGVSVVTLHSLLAQSERSSALVAFRSGSARVLVASDVASRGLDIPLTDLVINCHVPPEIPRYVHRVGRTARAGRKGVAITLVGPNEVGRLLGIEDVIGIKLEEHPAPEDEVLSFLPEANAAREMARLWWDETMSESNKRRKTSVRGD